MGSIAEPATTAEARSESRAKSPGPLAAAHSSSRAAASAWAALAAGALIAGVYLRATQLPAQIRF